MEDHFYVLVKGKASPLTVEMSFFYNMSRKLIFVRKNEKDLPMMWGGMEFQAFPLSDEDDLVRLLEHLAEIYHLVIEENFNVQIKGFLVFGLEAKE